MHHEVTVDKRYEAFLNVSHLVESSCELSCIKKSYSMEIVICNTLYFHGQPADLKLVHETFVHQKVVNSLHFQQVLNRESCILKQLLISTRLKYFHKRCE